MWHITSEKLAFGDEKDAVFEILKAFFAQK